MRFDDIVPAGWGPRWPAGRPTDFSARYGMDTDPPAVLAWDIDAATATADQLGHTSRSIRSWA